MRWRLPTLAALAAFGLGSPGSYALASGYLSHRLDAGQGGAGQVESTPRDQAPRSSPLPLELPSGSPGGARWPGVPTEKILDGQAVDPSASADLRAFEPGIGPAVV